jgi:hypothetical protein
MHVTIKADHKTTINTTLFDRAFDISVINKFPTSNENYKTAWCHVHYGKIQEHLTLFVVNEYISLICHALNNKHTDLATASLKVVSRKRRRKCTLKSYDRFTNS